MEQKQPLERLTDGRLKATVWENVSNEGKTYHTVTLAKTYEDRDGRLQDSHSFSSHELLSIAELAKEAHGLIRGINRDLAQERRADRQADQRSERSASSGEDRRGRSQKRPGPGLER